MTAVIITDAAWIAGFRAASAATLNASVITAMAPNSGQGGTAHSRLEATANRNMWPTSASHRPLARGNIAADASSAGSVGAAYRRPQMYPPTITNARPTTTSNDDNKPTSAAASRHHTASTSHDTRLPASASNGSDVLALSMNSAAFRIASRSAMPHRPAVAIRASAKYIRSMRPRISTMPGATLGSRGVPRQRANCGTPRYSSANATNATRAGANVSGVR